MSRFIQSTPKMKPGKKAQTPLPKPGKYTSKELKKSKPMYSGTGGKN